MFEFKKILVTTDFSDAAAAAYPIAETIASKYDSKVDFIHIVPTLKYFNESISKLGVPFSMEDDLYPHMQEEALAKLKKLMDEYLKEGHRGEAHAPVAPRPSTAIVDYAKDHSYDLVVIGSRGANETEMLKGSVAEKVIRHSEVPVFTINRRYPADSLKQIIFPTDGSRISFASFPMAVSLATIYDAEITLFHVMELYGTALEHVNHDPGKTEAQNVYETLLKELQEFFEKHSWDRISIRRGEEDFEDQLVLMEGASSTTVTLKTVIRKGVSAHQEIETYAEDHSDIVVMTTHGHTGLARFFLGSTTERIAQHLDTPVLTVKPSKDSLK